MSQSEGHVEANEANNVLGESISAEDVIVVHWHELENLVSLWLKERQSVIVLLCSVTGLKGIMSKETPVAIKIQAFCQVLVDYISAGHFEIYGKLLLEADEFGEDATSLFKKIYPLIDQTTEAALAFNDKYETHEKSALHFEDLNEDLSKLAESLSQRFDLEDQLIETLHACHQSQIN